MHGQRSEEPVVMDHDAETFVKRGLVVLSSHSFAEVFDERQGFLNGFRIGMRMEQEISQNSLG